MKTERGRLVMRDTREVEAVGFVILSGRRANEIRGKRFPGVS